MVRRGSGFAPGRGSEPNTDLTGETGGAVFAGALAGAFAVAAVFAAVFAGAFLAGAFAVAAFFAGLVWIVGRQLPRTALQRWLLRTPALLALLLAAAILGLVAYASLGIQAPETAPPRPVTAPSG